jgi:hypothetical protein
MITETVWRANRIKLSGFFVKRVEGHLIPYPQTRQREAGKSHSQADDTDDGLHFVFPHVAERDCQIMFYHNCKFFCVHGTPCTVIIPF